MADYLVSHQLFFAILTGLVPSLIWLFFWLRISKKTPEPWGLVLLCFVLGAASVMITIALQRSTAHLFTSTTTRVAVWAGIEEVLKFGIFYMVIFHHDTEKHAIDPALYMIAVALGFAAFENILYVLHPAGSFNVTTALLTGSLRFFGSTLLHAIASSFVGICIAIFAMRKLKNIGVLAGLATAIFLHAAFNFFILQNDTANFLQIYGFLWVAAIISHIILEKLRRVPLMK